MLTIPSKRVYDDMMGTLCPESFFFDYDNDACLCLFLKLLPKQIISIINGVSFRLVYRNPNIEQHCIVLYIDDIAGASFYISKSKYDDSQKCPIWLPDYIEIAKHFSSFDFIRVAIFDQKQRNVYTKDIKVILPDESIIQWINRMLRTDEAPFLNLNNPIENQDTGYTIRLRNDPEHYWVEHFNLHLNQIWGNNPYLASTNKYIHSFSIANYMEESLLGYFQEQTIKELLSDLFIPNLQMFHSPHLVNHTELTDFFIVVNRRIILIESKVDAAFNAHQDKIKKKESAVTSHIRKATIQLNRAQRIIMENTEQIENAIIKECCVDISRLYSICVIGDDMLVNIESIKSSLANYDRIPIIMSISVFVEMLKRFPNANMFVTVLEQVAEVLSFEEIPLFAGFSEN